MCDLQLSPSSETLNTVSWNILAMPKRLITLCFIHDRLPFVQVCKSIAAAPYQKINIGEPARAKVRRKS